MNSRARLWFVEMAAIGAAGTVAATIFCCLPFATGVLGASVAAFGARFVPFQPYLSGLSLALLGYAFYQAYQRSPVTCADDGCAVPSSVHMPAASSCG